MQFASSDNVCPGQGLNLTLYGCKSAAMLLQLAASILTVKIKLGGKTRQHKLHVNLS